MAITQVTVTGTVTLPDTTPVIGGAVTFALSNPITDGTTLITTTARVAICNSMGEFSIILSANDDSTTQPSGTYYTVTITYLGQIVEKFDVIISHLDNPTVDLFSIAQLPAPANVVEPYVSQIVAGSNVSISPGGGTGQVTISSTGGGSSGVSSFNTRTGPVTLGKNDITGTGLGPSDIGADSSGAAATAQTAAEAASIPVGQKGAASGVATLDSGSHLTSAQIPSYVVSATSATQGQLPFADGAGGFTWNLQLRGQIQYSTTYNPGDVFIASGNYVLTTKTFTTGSGTNGLGQPAIFSTNVLRLSSQGNFYAADYGVSAGNADNWTALQSLLILVRSLSGGGTGFKVILPAGYLLCSKTIIIPTHTQLIGQGLYSTTLGQVAGSSDHDIVQPERYNNSAQAALLTTLQSSLTVGNLVNAFRWGLRDLCVHGNFGSATPQTPGSYFHGVNIATNPLTSTTGSDPDFDPAGILENVMLRSCSGDGLFHNGRSALRLVNVISWFNGGNGITPSFDTQHDHCQAGFNGGAGWYFNHGANQGAGNKSYNNGGNQIQPWVSGLNWIVSQRCVYNGVFYDAINALTGDTASPDTDPTNWAPVTATSPQAWGVGVFLDSNAGEIDFNCDCQQNSADSWHVHGGTAGTFLSGVSDQPNYNQQSSALNSTNPNNYAHLVLDGCAGVVAAIACNDLSGHSSTQYRLRVVNAATHNDVTLAADTNGTFLSPDSLTLVGSGNKVSYSGSNFTQTLAALQDVSITSPSDGQLLAYNATTGKFQNAASGATFYGGLFGDGSDGSVTFDGTTTILGLVPSASTYTLTRDVFCAAITINSGVTIKPNGFKFYCQGAFTNNGSIVTDGNAGSAAGTGGAQGGSSGGSLGIGVSGSVGGTTTGTAGSTGLTTNANVGNGNGGAGGTGTSGNTGGSGSFSAQGAGTSLRTAQAGVTSIVPLGSPAGPRVLNGGNGGGGGGGDGTNKGGGGGGGASPIIILAKTFVNASTGTLSAKGGAGGTPSTGNCGGGGGGGGGPIVVYTTTAWTQNGTVTAAGGVLGSGVGTGSNGSAGSTGATLNVLVS